MADELYGRYWRVKVGRPLGDGASDLEELLTFEGLRTVFQAERSHKPDPNTGSISLYNLSQSTRSKLAGAGLSMTLEAGYIGHSSVILAGNVQRVSHRRDGADWVTKLETGDGAVAMAEARVSMSFGAGAKVVDVMKALAGKLKGINVDKALKKLGEVGFKRTLTDYVNGIAMVGQAREEFDKQLRAAGVEWSVQNGELIITAPGEPSDEEAIVLAPDSGLLGSPEPGETKKIGDKDAQQLSVRALIVPGLEPPRQVKIESRTFEGFARIEQTTYRGDSHGQDWSAELEVTPL